MLEAESLAWAESRDLTWAGAEEGFQMLNGTFPGGQGGTGPRDNAKENLRPARCQVQCSVQPFLREGAQHEFEMSQCFQVCFSFACFNFSPLLFSVLLITHCRNRTWLGFTVSRKRVSPERVSLRCEVHRAFQQQSWAEPIISAGPAHCLVWSNWGGRDLPRGRVYGAKRVQTAGPWYPEPEPLLQSCETAPLGSTRRRIQDPVASPHV